MNTAIVWAMKRVCQGRIASEVGKSAGTLEKYVTCVRAARSVPTAVIEKQP